MLHTIYIYTNYLLGGYSVQKVNDRKEQEELRKLKYKCNCLTRDHIVLFQTENSLKCLLWLMIHQFF